MKRTTMLKPELEERSFGSVYDPLLNGVAQGLSRLFPPVGTVRAPQPEDGPDRHAEARSEARRSGEVKRESHARS